MIYKNKISFFIILGTIIEIVLLILNSFIIPYEYMDIVNKLIVINTLLLLLPIFILISYQIIKCKSHKKLTNKKLVLLKIAYILITVFFVRDINNVLIDMWEEKSVVPIESLMMTKDYKGIQVTYAIGEVQNNRAEVMNNVVDYYNNKFEARKIKKITIQPATMQCYIVTTQNINNKSEETIYRAYTLSKLKCPTK